MGRGRLRVAPTCRSRCANAAQRRGPARPVVERARGRVARTDGPLTDGGRLGGGGARRCHAFQPAPSRSACEWASVPEKRDQCWPGQGRPTFTPTSGHRGPTGVGRTGEGGSPRVRSTRRWMPPIPSRRRRTSSSCPRPVLIRRARPQPSGWRLRRPTSSGCLDGRVSLPRRPGHELDAAILLPAFRRIVLLDRLSVTQPGRRKA